jgi:lipopolysaccharide export LptBFGC system permease protein LptF
MGGVSDLERSRTRVPRAQREQRAYRLVVAGSTLGLLAVVGIVLAIAGVVSAGPPIIAAIVAGICFLLFRRTVSG